jgi:hypothetical protein
VNAAHWKNPARINPEIEATRNRVNERFCMAVAPQPVASRRPLSWWIITGAQLVAISLPALALWVLFS